ncbi:type II/IV secretion system protein [Leptotrichia sp. OH3620_COT-345]|uniref:GspE/PulE family protein n=1 Tax=Leptotrichia sp. OH3620_COT-345 TaxID=2491048 RepID=UPI000F64965A|nr:GspE/PulE family protein [Leptotrichia sp. OH3620_COT-345]RRD37947.1 type II/IV secretion system protein [Leptotrichia sp. OH3620_COT-345]
MKNVISYVNDILEMGIKERASDIHIKYDNDESEIKFRVDGILTESLKLEEKVSKTVFSKNIIEIISRLKILSEMNVAEKRKPQDGSFSFGFNGENYDIRAAFMPTVNGESIVLRILKSYLENTELETLGFSEKNRGILNRILSKKYGLILVSGPTGSGKSTTLMSIINILNNGEKKIISVEDPVENKIKGIVQVQVNEDIGVTFPEILKNTLRNDPDIIVISEIRDEITAEIAVRAALTGHLVIATIHTNDAISTIIRLSDMGIPKYLILDSLIGIIAQRLVGGKCRNCSGKGCKNCIKGYNGRISINEILAVSEKIKSILKDESSVHECKIKLKSLQYENFTDFEEDIKEKLAKNMLFEKDVFEFIN